MKIGILIAIAYIVWQIVYSVTQKAQSAQCAEQQRRARELARQGGGAPAGRAPAAGRPPGSVQASRRLDDLAERRRKQLEELRQRRGKRPGRATTTQARVGAAPGTVRPSTPARATPSVPRPTPGVRTMSAPVAASAESELWEEGRRQQREKAAREKSRHAAKESRRREDDLLKELERMKAEHRAALHLATAAPAPALAHAPGAVSLGSIRRRLADPSLLRELFVLKEVIDPPLSIREEESGPRA